MIEVNIDDMTETEAQLFCAKVDRVNKVMIAVLLVAVVWSIIGPLFLKTNPLSLKILVVFNNT